MHHRHKTCLDRKKWPGDFADRRSDKRRTYHPRATVPKIGIQSQEQGRFRRLTPARKLLRPTMRAREYQGSRRSLRPSADVATYPIPSAQIAIPNTAEWPAEIGAETRKPS